MKKLKKLLCLFLSLTMVFCAVVGCGKDNDPDTLRINIFEGGYGTEWMDDMIAYYNEVYPDQKVEKRVIYQSSDAVNELKSGSSDVDIYFNKTDISKFVLKPTNLFGTTYDTLLEDLTDIYNEKLPGEDVTLKEKMESFTLDFNTYTDSDGVDRYYATPWAVGVVGIIKNNKIWRDTWKTPRTTEELFAVLDTIKSDTGKAPIIYSLADSYWNLFYNVWFYQYEGIEGYKNFYQGIDATGKRYTPEFLLYQGRIEALKTMERLLTPDNGYCNDYSYSVNATSAQNYFLEGTLGAPLTCNADWMNGELLKNYSNDEIDLDMIKAPIISSIVEKLSFYTHGSMEYTSLSDAEKSAYDAVLTEIVDYVDGIKTEKPVTVNGYTVTDADIAKISEARGITVSASLTHQAWIPIYEHNKDAAKKFLQLMATNKGIEIFTKASKGYILPYSYDYSNLESHMSGYLKSVNSFVNETIADPDDNRVLLASNIEKDPIFALGGVSQFGNNTGNFIKQLAAKNVKDRKGAEELILEDYRGVKDRWSSYLTLASITA